ncbi:MAG: hypothetical protein MUP02_01615 [Actinobacteria bacterium]|nr:hypothetical protein [Actinomycetota bacterium]
MYKCLNCGNTDKFYGIAKEQGNALIFQNCGVVNGSDGSSVLEEALNALRKSSDRHKQPVGALSGPNAVFIDEGPFRTGIQDAVSGVSDKKHLPKSGGDPGAAPADPDMTIRGNLWAIQTDGKGEDITWAYITSDRSWKGFHEVRSCAVCRSTSIASI